MILLLIAIFGWQLQGGIRQQIQAPVHTNQVQAARVQIQADGEIGDFIIAGDSQMLNTYNLQGSN